MLKSQAFLDVKQLLLLQQKSLKEHPVVHKIPLRTKKYKHFDIGEKGINS